MGTVADFYGALAKLLLESSAFVGARPLARAQSWVRPARTPASTITGSGRAGSPGHRSDCKVASTAPARTKWSSGLRSQRLGVALSIKRLSSKRLSSKRLSFKRPFKCPSIKRLGLRGA